ncbi:hypothetical protein VTN96DRAFT_4352 [Rasamsonia emersonii]
MEDIERSISQAPRPIRGIIHLAILLRDAPIAKMAFSNWVAANAPKVTGTWNLHKRFKEEKSLDFFVLASSMVTIVERPGQGNYSKEFDMLEIHTIDPENPGRSLGIITLIEDEDSTAVIFEKFLMTGDDRNIAKVYVRGWSIKAT